MAQRGPKPVDADLLTIHATQWACLLYGLRDGYPGQLQRVEWGPTEMAHFGEEETPMRNSKPTAATTIIYPGSKEQDDIERMLRKISSTLERQGYIYFRPVMPKPEVWRELKRAKQLGQIQNVFRKMRRWAVGLRRSSRRISVPNTRAMYLGDMNRPNRDSASKISEITRSGTPVAWYLLPLAMSSSWAEEILKAKSLWNYPKTERPRSDDKRIKFFAKSFAALTLGQAPATATGRWLSGWHWPKDWFESVKGVDLSEGKP
jgi:hypothetical protein